MKRLAQIDGLRGLSAAAVMLYHFTSRFPDGFWHDVGGHVLFGLFFVVSGLVMPLACRRELQCYRHVGIFLKARLLRLYLPFLASLVLVIGLQALSEAVPGFSGDGVQYTPATLVANLLLVADLAGRPWLNPVYWTLALEVQWYLLLALTAPLLIGHAWRFVLLASALTLISNQYMVFHWLPLFGMGWVLGHLHLGLSGRLAAAAQIVLLLAVMALAHGAYMTGIAMVGVLALTGFGGLVARLQPLGAISYSLYLLHVPLGGRVINLALRAQIDSVVVQTLALLLATALSLLAAAAFARWVEAPAIARSRRVRARLRGASGASANMPESPDWAPPAVVEKT